ncbi:hypothetical protein D9M68_975400 [compost metagenome]
MEGVRRGLADADVAVRHDQVVCQLPGLATVEEVGFGLLVLDHHHGQPGGPHLGAEAIDGGDDTVDLESGVLADADGALDVDDQESGFHGQRSLQK